MASNKKVFAANLTRYMELAGKTRMDVCNALGFKYSTFTDWVNGTKFPRIDKIEMLANYFGIEKSDLIEEKQPVHAGGLSIETREIAEIIEALPAEQRRMLLLQVRALRQEIPNPVAPE